MSGESATAAGAGGGLGGAGGGLGGAAATSAGSGSGLRAPPPPLQPHGLAARIASALGAPAFGSGGRFVRSAGRLLWRSSGASSVLGGGAAAAAAAAAASSAAFSSSSLPAPHSAGLFSSSVSFRGTSIPLLGLVGAGGATGKRRSKHGETLKGNVGNTVFLGKFVSNLDGNLNLLSSVRLSVLLKRFTMPARRARSLSPWFTRHTHTFPRPCASWTGRQVCLCQCARLHCALQQVHGGHGHGLGGLEHQCRKLGGEPLPAGARIVHTRDAAVHLTHTSRTTHALHLHGTRALALTHLFRPPSLPWATLLTSSPTMTLSPKCFPCTRGFFR
jgi:hypothetical protein